MACTLHVNKEKTFDCTCARTQFSMAVERVRLAYHATHRPGSYGDHSECCALLDGILDEVRRMESNPDFIEEYPKTRRMYFDD